MSPQPMLSLSTEHHQLLQVDLDLPLTELKAYGRIFAPPNIR